VISVDTNIIVRLITGDDEQQVKLATSLAEREVLYVSLTVLIEAEWVLRSSYEYDRNAICAAFEALPQVLNLSYQDEVGVRWALERYSLGGELADYIHLVSSAVIGRFATFEKRLPKRAGDATPSIINVLS
jgi:predicted nucleic-acid-binding protein